MKISIHEKFHNFLVRNNLTIQIIQKMIIEYAESPNDLARSYFMNKYNISEHVFYSCRDYAVICCLVDNKICKKIRKKTCENYSSHNEKNISTSSVVHFRELMDKREKYIFSFTEFEIFDIAKKYLGGMTSEQIGLAYETGKYGINVALYRGIAELILDRETVENIKTIIPSSIGLIISVREENKKKLIKNLSSLINSTKYLISNYSIVFRNDKNAPYIEDLEDQLSILKKYYEIALKL